MSQPTIQPGRTPQLTPNPNRFPSSHYGPRLGQKPPDTDQKPGDQQKLVSSPSVTLSLPGLQQMPKEKETQNQQVFTEQVFAGGDANVLWQATPRVVSHSQLNIVLDEENGNRDDHIGTSF